MLAGYREKYCLNITFIKQKKPLNTKPHVVFKETYCVNTILLQLYISIAHS